MARLGMWPIGRLLTSGGFCNRALSKGHNLSGAMPSASSDSGMAPLTPSWSPPSVLGMTSLPGLMSKRGRIADSLITALAFWIFAFSAIIPSLDRELLGSDVTIESEHHEGCSHPRHDHTICIQFGKQDWSRISSIPLEMFPPAAGESVAARHDVPVELLRRIPSQSRAPPHTT